MSMYSRVRDAIFNQGVFAAAPEEKTPRPQMVELGATGTSIFNQELAEQDYNADLTATQATTVYDKMRRSDGQVKAALLACELPLRGAKWEISTESDKAADVDAAEFCEDNFWSMSITFDDWLRHVLTMLPFGFSVFEKVWEVKDGRIRLRKLAPRLQRTVVKFIMDSQGGLSEVEQQVTIDNIWRQIRIPVDKLLVFSLDREGSNYRGVSLLRSAYKHWYYKDNLYRIDAMAAERHGLGVPHFSYPANATPSSKSNIEKIGQNLQAHHKAYVSLPDDYGFDFKVGQGRLHNTIASIEHHNVMITMSILAQFLNLGTGDIGSWALSRDQSSFFLMSLKAMAENICDTVNRYVIPQLVDLNFRVDEYPEMKVSGLEVKDLGIWSKAITDLVNAGAITKDEEMENVIRGWIGMPQLEKPPEPQTPEPEPEGQLPKEPQEEEQKAHDHRAHLKVIPKQPSVKISPISAAELAKGQVFMKELDKVMDEAEKQLVSRVSEVQKRQIENLVDQAVKMLKAGTPDKLKDIDVRYKSEVTDVFADIFGQLFERGREDVQKDLKKNVKRAAEPVILRARALATTGVLSARLKAALTWQALNQFGLGIVDTDALTATLLGLSEKLIKDIAKIGISEAYNIGRKEEAAQHKISKVYRQSLLDENTCATCEALDVSNSGDVWDYASDEWRNYEPPDDGACEGMDKCRCILVFVSGEEGKK